MSKSSLVRVKHKGQVTIPVELREELGIEEGSMLEARLDGDGIVLRAKRPLRPGKVVGREEHEKIVDELNELRRDWR
jgi:AbrB family looped-hinge helix DNA binding protein